MQWEELVSTDNERVIEAKLTNEFWQECPPRLAVGFHEYNCKILVFYGDHKSLKAFLKC